MKNDLSGRWEDVYFACISPKSTNQPHFQWKTVIFFLFLYIRLNEMKGIRCGICAVISNKNRLSVTHIDLICSLFCIFCFCYIFCALFFSSSSTSFGCYFRALLWFFWFHKKMNSQWIPFASFVATFRVTIFAFFSFFLSFS